MARHSRNRSKRTLHRKAPTREPRASVLIVCEGAKTEPAYFDELRRHLKLTTAEIRIADHAGSAPISIVDTAKRLQKERKKDANRDTTLVEYDEIYCVMDVEVPHAQSLPRALDKARKLDDVEAILSNPCFEFWFLLHFKHTGQSFGSSQEVVGKLKFHLPGYAKGKNVFDNIYPRTERAYTHAENLFKQQWHTQKDRPCQCNPCTQVHELVKRLHAIAEAPLPSPSEATK